METKEGESSQKDGGEGENKTVEGENKTDEGENKTGQGENKTSRVQNRVKAFLSGLVKVEEEVVDPKTESENEPEEEKSDDGCHCKMACLGQFKTSQVNKHRKKMTELEKPKWEKHIMKSLQSFGKEKTGKGKKGGKRKRERYKYVFGGKPICKKAFCFLYNIGNKCLKNLQKHMSKHGNVPRIHGNKGRKPSHAIDFDKAHHAIDWLERFADAHGFQMSEPPKSQEAEPPTKKKTIYDEKPVMLPLDVTKKALHQQYSAVCAENNLKPLGLTSFKNVWQHCAPHIKMKPREIDPNRKPRRRKKKTDGSAADNPEDGRRKKRKPMVKPEEQMQGHVQSQGQQMQPVPPAPIPSMPIDFTQDNQRREWQEYLNNLMHSQPTQAAPIPTMPLDFSQVPYSFDCMQNMQNMPNMPNIPNMQMSHQQMGSCMMLPPENPGCSTSDWIRKHHNVSSS